MRLHHLGMGRQQVLLIILSVFATVRALLLGKPSSLRAAFTFSLSFSHCTLDASVMPCSLMSKHPPTHISDRPLAHCLARLPPQLTNAQVPTNNIEGMAALIGKVSTQNPTLGAMSSSPNGIFGARPLGMPSGLRALLANQARNSVIANITNAFVDAANAPRTAV
jgi:hypothetical protein